MKKPSALGESGSSEQLKGAGILLAVDSLQVGGAERQVTDLALALRTRGYLVSVACSVGGPYQRELERAGVVVHVLLGRLVKRRLDAEYAAAFVELMTNLEFDLIHAHLYATQTAILKAAVAARIPLVITEHSENRWQSLEQQRIQGLIRAHADAVIAVSRSIAQHLASSGHSSGSLHTIHNARRSRKEHQISRPSAWHGLRGQSTELHPRTRRRRQLVGVVARLHAEKGVDIFLRAASIISDTHPEVRFTVAGDGPSRRTLETLSKQLGITERLTFAGCVADARRLIRRLSVLAVPSFTEGSPLVVLEAMAEGTPIVATRVGGIPELIRDGREGLLVPAADRRALASGISSLLEDNDAAERLREAARLRVETDFSHERMVDRILAVYRWTLFKSTRAESSWQNDVQEASAARRASFADAPAMATIRSAIASGASSRPK